MPRISDSPAVPSVRVKPPQAPAHSSCVAAGTTPPSSRWGAVDNVHTIERKPRADQAAARGRGFLFRSPAADGQLGYPVPRLGHLCAGELHRHRPADQGRRRVRQGGRRAEDAPLFQGARLRRGDRRRALALPDHARRTVRRHHHQHADGHDPCHRRMVRQCARGRAVRGEGQAGAADAVHLVEDLRPGPSPLRHGRRRAHDPQTPRGRSTGISC